LAELPDAKKWFTGFFDVTRYIKDFGTILRMILILSLIYFIGMGGVAFYKRIISKKEKTTIGQVQGNVDASTCNTKTKIGLINI
jgi:hypothetical protein